MLDPLQLLVYKVFEKKTSRKTFCFTLFLEQNQSNNNDQSMMDQQDNSFSSNPSSESNTLSFTNQRQPPNTLPSNSISSVVSQSPLDELEAQLEHVVRRNNRKCCLFSIEIMFVGRAVQRV